jgi:hypothetical protein
MHRQDWRRLGWVAIGLMVVNLGLLAALWWAPMPPRTLPNPPPISPATVSASVAPLPAPAASSAAELAALDAVLAGRLEQVALAQGAALSSVMPAAELRQAARTAVDPHSAAVQDLLAAYAEAFAALDPSAP